MNVCILGWYCPSTCRGDTVLVHPGGDTVPEQAGVILSQYIQRGSVLVHPRVILSGTILFKEYCHVAMIYICRSSFWRCEEIKHVEVQSENVIPSYFGGGAITYYIFTCAFPYMHKISCFILLAARKWRLSAICIHSFPLHMLYAIYWHFCHIFILPRSQIFNKSYTKSCMIWCCGNCQGVASLL